MRVLIFEPQFMGHNLVHAARLVRGVRELGCVPVLATSSQAVRSAEFAKHIEAHLTGCEVVELDGFKTDPHGRRLQTNGVAGSIHVYRSLKWSIDRSKPGHLYVPYGNFLARMAAAPFGLSSALRRCGAEAETLMVGGRYLYAKTGLLHRVRQRALLNAIAAGPWASVFHLDDAAYEQFQRHGGRMARIGKLLPEPVGDHAPTDRLAARRSFGIPTEGRLVAVIGLIERRKGLDLLTDAFRRAESRLEATDRLALIGPHHPEVKELLTTDYADLVARGRVVGADHRLSEAEMVRAACAADVVATVYPNHLYASGSLVVAAQARRPVLGSDAGWIGRTIERFQLGHTCDPAQPLSVAGGLIDSFDAASAYQPSPAAMRFVDFVSDRNYLALWTSRLRERLGVEPSPHARSWGWALHGETRKAA
ncbi:MAG: hypothetical protein AAF589_03120 [Planctomycetota bacterium]